MGKARGGRGAGCVLGPVTADGAWASGPRGREASREPSEEGRRSNPGLLVDKAAHQPLRAMGLPQLRGQGSRSHSHLHPQDGQPRPQWGVEATEGCVQVAVGCLEAMAGMCTGHGGVSRPRWGVCRPRWGRPEDLGSAALWHPQALSGGPGAAVPAVWLAFPFHLRLTTI